MYEHLVLRGTAQTFSALTFPRLGRFLSPVGESWIAVGLTAGHRNIGLALGTAEGDRAALLSIFIDPFHRRRGLGGRLLHAWQAEALRRGHTRVSARFSNVLPRREAFTALVASMGWSTPQLSGLRLAGIAGKMGRAGGEWRGVRRILHNPAFTYEPLAFTHEDEVRVDLLLQQPEARFAGDPRQLVDQHIPETSRALRVRGELAGWIVATSPSREIAAGFSHTNVVEYRELYVDRRFWSQGIALGAFYRCFLAQEAHFGVDSIATYHTHPGMARMLSFTLKRFAPMAMPIHEAFEVTKDLVAD